MEEIGISEFIYSTCSKEVLNVNVLNKTEFEFDVFII